MIRQDDRLHWREVRARLENILADLNVPMVGSLREYREMEYTQTLQELPIDQRRLYLARWCAYLDRQHGLIGERK